MVICENKRRSRKVPWSSLGDYCLSEIILWVFTLWWPLLRAKWYTKDNFYWCWSSVQFSSNFMVAVLGSSCSVMLYKWLKAHSSEFQQVLTFEYWKWIHLTSSWYNVWDYQWRLHWMPFRVIAMRSAWLIRVQLSLVCRQLIVGTANIMIWTDTLDEYN